MMTTNNNINPARTARIAGFLYTLMIPLGMFGVMYAPTALLVAGDAEATAQNVLANMGMFRLSIAVALCLGVLGIFIVLFLYRLLKPVHKNLASLMVIFMLVSVPLGMLNELNYIAILRLLSGADYLSVYSAEQLDSLTLMLFELHEYGIIIVSIFWGLWLLPMGYLVIKSGFIPKILGIFLLMAGVVYPVDSFAKLLLPDYSTTVIASIVTVILFGEILFPIWLLVKGVDLKGQKKHMLKSNLV